MRIYTMDRINKMSMHERKTAIEAVKTSNTLTVDEKKENLRLLEVGKSTQIAHMQIVESAADIGDINS